MERLRTIVMEMEQASLRAFSDPDDARTFLDRFRRSTSFSPADRKAAGVEASVERCLALQGGDAASSLGLHIAKGLNLEAILDSGYDLCSGGGEASAATAWCLLCLEVGNVLPFLPEKTAARAMEVLEGACRLIESYPSVFLGAAKEAEDRLEGEPLPAGHALRLLEALAKAPELASVDTEAFDGPSVDIEDILRNIPTDVLENADKAIRDSLDWRARVIELRKRAQATAGVFAAATHGEDERHLREEDHVLLRTLPEGQLLFSRRGSELFVDWYGEGIPTLTLAGTRLLEEDRFHLLGAGRRWLLPPAERDLRLVFELGPTRLVIEL